MAEVNLRLAVDSRGELLLGERERGGRTGGEAKKVQSVMKS